MMVYKITFYQFSENDYIFLVKKAIEGSIMFNVTKEFQSQTETEWNFKLHHTVNAAERYGLIGITLLVPLFEIDRMFLCQKGEWLWWKIQ